MKSHYFGELSWCCIEALIFFFITEIQPERRLGILLSKQNIRLIWLRLKKVVPLDLFQLSRNITPSTYLIYKKKNRILSFLFFFLFNEMCALNITVHVICCMNCSTSLLVSLQFLYFSATLDSSRQH